jgi:hypothetical protein
MSAQLPCGDLGLTPLDPRPFDALVVGHEIAAQAVAFVDRGPERAGLGLDRQADGIANARRVKAEGLVALGSPTAGFLGARRRLWFAEVSRPRRSSRTPRGSGSEPRALQEFPVRLHGHAAVSGATAFAFAGVFAFATVVTGFAAALAFTGVLSFTGVGACLLLRQGLERDSGLRGCAGCIGADRERPGNEPGHRGACDECFRCFHLFFYFVAFELLICGGNPP